MGRAIEGGVRDGLARFHRHISHSARPGRATDRRLLSRAVNAALAFIEAVKPKDEVEAALAIQMACTHSAGMAVLRRVASGMGSDRTIAIMASAGMEAPPGSCHASSERADDRGTSGLLACRQALVT